MEIDAGARFQTGVRAVEVIVSTALLSDETCTLFDIRY
jgi:hypothetical protein